MIAEPREGFTGVGVVIRPHGIRGEVRVTAFNPEALNLQSGRHVHTGDVRRRIQRARADRGHWILQLEGVGDRDAAEALRGVLLECPDTALKRGDPDAFYVHELIGLRVETVDGRDLGRIVDVLTTGANDVYVVRGEHGEALIPAIGQVISAVDVRAGLMTITPLPGLLNDSE